MSSAVGYIGLNYIPGLTDAQKEKLRSAGINTASSIKSHFQADSLPCKLSPTSLSFVMHRPEFVVPLVVAKSLVDTLQHNSYLGSRKLAKSRIILVGSGRRGKEFLKDIDVLVVVKDSWFADDPEILSKFSVRCPPGRGRVDVVDSYASGNRRRSIVVSKGRKKYRMDLFLAVDSDKPFALMHHTGSWEYNVRIRSHARDRGWKLNQYGVFYRNSGRPVRGSEFIHSEKDLAAFLGVSFRTPQSRNS